MLQIKEALTLYNEKNKPKMKLKELAEKVIDWDISSSTKASYLSLWAKGKKYGTLTPDVIVNICKETGVDPNYLFNYKKQK